MLTLIEKTQKLYSDEQAKKLEEKILKQSFTLDDFLDQMRQVRKLGLDERLSEDDPGSLQARCRKTSRFPKESFAKVEAIICSMTRGERRNPDLLNGSRRKRIARGSGTQVSDVNRLVKQFDQARQMMKHLSGDARRRNR